MDNDNITAPQTQEWRWCLVGNIVEEHEYGEEHIKKKGQQAVSSGG